MTEVGPAAPGIADPVGRNWGGSGAAGGVPAAVGGASGIAAVWVGGIAAPLGGEAGAPAFMASIVAAILAKSAGAIGGVPDAG